MKSALRLLIVLIMINLIKANISQNYSNISFDLSNWDDVLRDCSNVSVFYLKSTIAYYEAYFKGQNLSFVLKENNSPLAIMPLFAHENERGWVLSTNGDGLIGPLILDGTPKKLKKRIEKQIADIIIQVASTLKIQKISLFEGSPFLSSWHLLWLEKSSKDFLTYQLAIDLNQTIEEIKLGFRKSYKPLVNKALRQWNVEVCDPKDDKVFDEFRLLHLEEAGRQTRNEESWNIQKNQIVNKEAFLISVRDDLNLIGAGFFTYTKDIGMYSVGAYKRDLFDKPIGHAVQVIAIRTLKEIGCATYHLGQKFTSLGSENATEKELSISHFKEGFSGYVYVQPHLEVTI